MNYTINMMGQWLFSPLYDGLSIKLILTVLHISNVYVFPGLTANCYFHFNFQPNDSPSGSCSPVCRLGRFIRFPSPIFDFNRSTKQHCLVIARRMRSYTEMKSKLLIPPPHTVSKMARETKIIKLA